MPDVLGDVRLLDDMVAAVARARSHAAAKAAVSDMGLGLWNDAVARVQAGQLDDRPLYWQRLYLNRSLRGATFGYPITPAQRHELIELHETASRGQSSLNLTGHLQHGAQRVVVTGFDPFLLDRNLKQVNPSGVVALSLDGRVMESGVVIETAMMPVRYGDFDEGEVEGILAPVYANSLAAMVVTVSMGRDHFDLERFPGLRRSATAPGNRNVLSGGSAENPVVPRYLPRYAPRAEFVEFSLPAQAMLEAEGAYEVRINSRVATLESGEFEAANLAALQGQTAVRGGGGGYLSNEISYRSINLREHLRSEIPTGHIHTPRIVDDQPGPITDIVRQTTLLIQLAIEALDVPGTE